MSQYSGTYGTMYYVDDMAKAVSFYKEALGVSPTMESPEWTEFNFGGHALCLHLKRAGDPNTEKNGILIIKAKGLKNLYASMKQKGVEFTHEPREVHPGAIATDFSDPSGNLVSLYENLGGNPS